MSRFMRLFPGETEFREVNEKEYRHDIHPHEIERMLRNSLTPEQRVALEAFEKSLGIDQKDPGFAGEGLVCHLEGELLKFDRPGGKLLEARRWPSKSYVRWFARIARMMGSGSAETLNNDAAVAYVSSMATDPVTGSQVGLEADPTVTDYTGANMAIGSGVGAEDSGYTNLIVPIANQVARQAVYTTTENAAQITFSVNEGITIIPAAVSITEIGLFAYILPFNFTTVQRTLMAYDQVAATPFTQGQVAVPKYTLSFVA